MSAVAKPVAQPESFPPAMREYWRTWVTRECMRSAACLNLVPYGESQLARLPVGVHATAVKLCADLVTRACRAEAARGGRRHPKIAHLALTELWRGLKPFTQRGEFYVEHLVGPVNVQREFGLRCGDAASLADDQEGST